MVRWTSLCDVASKFGGKRKIDEAEIVLSLDGGRSYPIRVTPELRPCATRFLWTVPALPTVHARLALRSGFEERDETETLRILSAEFRILRDPDGRVEQLRRHVNEWWIPPTPAVLTAEDLLEGTMSPANTQISVPVASVEAAIPTTFSLTLRPSRAAALSPVAHRASGFPDSPSRTRSAGASTPLRL